MVPSTVKHVVFVVISLFSVGKASVNANNGSSMAISEFPEYAKYPPKPLVCITSGCIIGATRNGLENGQFEAFFGVPYARPPLGKLRFKNPVPVEPWTGNYDATYERSKCVQKNDARPQSLVEGSEDCLYLNVYRPKYDNNIEHFVNRQPNHTTTGNGQPNHTILLVEGQTSAENGGQWG